MLKKSLLLFSLTTPSLLGDEIYGLASIDRKGRITRLNPRALEVYGLNLRTTFKNLSTNCKAQFARLSKRVHIKNLRGEFLTDVFPHPQINALFLALQKEADVTKEEIISLGKGRFIKVMATTRASLNKMSGRWEGTFSFIELNHLEFDGLMIDFTTKQVTFKNSQAITVPDHLFDYIPLFVQNPIKFYSHEKISISSVDHLSAREIEEEIKELNELFSQKIIESSKSLGYRWFVRTLAFFKKISGPQTFKVDDLHIDPESRLIFKRTRRVHLEQRFWPLFLLFARNPARPLSYGDIKRGLNNPSLRDGTIRTYIQKINEAFNEDIIKKFWPTWGLPT